MNTSDHRSRMKIDCTKLRDHVAGFSLIASCDEVKDGAIRMATPFQYPDGSQIDIFAHQPQLLGEIEFSDKGQTISYLLDLHVKPWKTKRRKQIVSDICESLGVTQIGGELVIRLPMDKITEAPSVIVRLAQACIRVTDIAFTHEDELAVAARRKLQESHKAWKEGHDYAMKQAQVTIDELTERVCGSTA